MSPVVFDTSVVSELMKGPQDFTEVDLALVNPWD